MELISSGNTLELTGSLDVRRTADARRLVLNLTDDGEQTIARNSRAALDVSQETLRPLTLAERMMLVELLKKIC